MRSNEEQTKIRPVSSDFTPSNLTFFLTSFRRDINKCLKLCSDPQSVPASRIIKDEISLTTCFSKTQIRLK